MDEQQRTYAELQAEVMLMRQRVAEFEAAAQESAQRHTMLQAILQDATDGMILFDQRGNILEANSAFYHLFGYAPPDLPALNICHLEPFDNEAQIAERLQQVISQGQQRFERLQRRKDRSLFEAEITITHLPEHGGRLFAVIRDITERIRTEQELLRTSLELNTIYQTLPDLYFRLAHDGTILDYRAGRHNDLFAPPADFLGKRMQDVLPPEVGQRYEAAIQNINDARSQVEFEYTLALPQGLQFFEASILPAADEQEIVLVRNITARRQAEMSLRASEERYRALFELANDAIFLETENDEILDANPAASRLLGYTSEEFRRIRVANLRAPELRSLDGSIIHHDLQSPSARLFESIDQHKNGARIPVEVSLSRAGENGLVIAIVRDITERQQAEQQLKASLQEKETLLRELYHRTRNNMEVINAMLGLQAETIEAPSLRGLIETTQKRIHSMALVHEKLYVSHNLSRIDLSEYIRDLTELLQTSYCHESDQIELRLELCPVEVNIDAAMPCGMIVNELVSNALIHAFPGQRQGVIHIHLERCPGGEILLEVTDDGVGLPPGVNITQPETIGLMLVTSLAGQLHADLHFAHERGLTCRLLFRDNLYEARI